jgi:hypothetical protein
MSNEFADELTATGERLRVAAGLGDKPEVAGPLRQLKQAAIEIGETWCGSPLGYHARVYYADFKSPPAGAHWSSEWGSYPALSGSSTGEWREYTHDAVVTEIRHRADDPDLSAAQAASLEAQDAFKAARGEVMSVLTAYLSERHDDLIEGVKTEAEKILVGTADQFIRASFPSGQVMSRDSLAVSQGFVAAPHIVIQGEVLALQSPFRGCSELADVAFRGAAHIVRLGAARRVTAPAQGNAVFIGHGGSLLWRELKDFIADRVELAWEEFNRVPVAGVTNITRLSDMLDATGIAFVVLTAEDEHATGEAVARQNVVHEAGLFQGRLGFARAIVLLEEGCAGFSNIEGLGQIRFPKGNIGAAFEEVRRVLEREGFVDS